jgi:hypothetical protein
MMFAFFRARKGLSNIWPAAIVLIFLLGCGRLNAQVFAAIPAASFSKPFSGADPLPQTLTVSSVGAGFNFTTAVSTSSGGTWLSVSSLSWNGCSLCPTPHVISVIVTTLPTMAPGTYNGQIVFTSQFGAVTLTVPVTLTVTATTSAYFDDLPGEMSFSLLTSGLPPPSQSIQVRNGGSGTLNWNLTTSTADGGNWLTASSASGTAPSNITFSLSILNLPGAGMTAGTFIGQISFQTSGDSVTIPVAVVVGANVFSQINGISFTKPFSGADPLPQTLTIPSTGTNFTYSVKTNTAKGGSWLSVSDPSWNACSLCTTPHPLNVIITTLPTLAVGTYTGQVVITQQFGSMTITVPVTLTVEPSAGTYFNNLQGQMAFSLQTGGISVTSQDLQILNGGTGTLNWTATAITADGGNWLTISSPLGSAPSLITVRVSVASLPSGGLIAGTFIGQIALQTAGDIPTIPIAVVVGADILSQVNPIGFTKLFAGLNPLPQTITIPSTGASFNFSYHAFTATGGNWLSVTTLGWNACSLCAAPETLSISVNPSPTLAVGTYIGQIVITDQFGLLSLTVPVTLTIAPAGTPYFDNLPGQLSYSIKTLSTANPPAQTIQIRNGGAGTLSWTLEVTTADGGNWLAASSLTGTAPSTMTISVTTSNLPSSGLIAGTFIGNLLFRSSTGDSIAVPVSVVVGDNIVSQINGLYFTMAFGGPNPLPQTFTAASTGTNFNFAYTSFTATGGTWLSVASHAWNACALCTTPSALTAIVNAASIPGPGTYTGEIIVTTQFGSMSITVPVTLTVVPAGGPHFGDIPGQMTFFLQPGGSPPPLQSVLIQDGGSGRLDWTLGAITSDSGTWLNISAGKGTAPSSITVGISPGALPGLGLIAGTFTGQLLLQSINGNVSIPVTVVVDPNVFVQVPPLIFLKTVTSSNPLPQNVTVASTGTNFNFSVIASTASGGNWLTVSGAAGCALCTTPKAVTATVNASSALAPGIYVGQIVITSQFGNLTMIIPVTLTIRPTSGLGAGTATHFLVTAPSSATAGVPVQFTVTALDPSNATVTTFTDPVHVITTDVFAATPTDVFLTSGVGTFSVSLVRLGTQSIIVSDSFVPSIAGASGGIMVSAAQGLQFVPIIPCRVADTRSFAGLTGAFGPPYLGPSSPRGQTWSFPLPTGVCGTFSGAVAYAVNVAVKPHSTLNYLTVWPTGQTQPNASTLNSRDGRVKANAAIVAAGTSGAISVFVTDDTEVILDVSGYFVLNTDPSGLAFYPITPCRIMDTRGNGFTGPFGPPSLTSPGATGTSRTVPVLASSCGVPVTAQAYSLNFTSQSHGSPMQWLTAWPNGPAEPNESTLNAPTGTVVANAAIVLAGTVGCPSAITTTCGAIDIYVHDTTDVIVDINGYFAPPGTGGLSFYPLAPCRVLDTRFAPYGSPFTGELDVNVLASVCGGTPSTQAYVFNATVKPAATPMRFITLWPQGETQPNASNLNAFDGFVSSNMAIVPTTNTEISTYASDPTFLILDLSGYFAP